MTEAAEIGSELSWQMGRPIRYAPNEVRGTLERARYMIGAASAALAFWRNARRESMCVITA